MNVRDFISVLIGISKNMFKKNNNNNHNIKKTAYLKRLKSEKLLMKEEDEKEEEDEEEGLEKFEKLLDHCERYFDEGGKMA